MQRIKLVDAIADSTILQGYCIARSFVDGEEKGKLPVGDNTDFILGLAAGIARPKYRVVEGVLDGTGKFVFAGARVNFVNPSTDIMAVLAFDSSSAVKYTWDVTPPADGADPTFEINNYTELAFHVSHATKTIQVRYNPLLTELEISQSFDVGLVGGLNQDDSSQGEGYVDVYEEGEQFSTFNIDIGATFKDGFGYATSTGKLGDQVGTEVAAIRVLKNSSPENPAILCEVL